ncbi:MAG: DUF6112 family protein [Candidatus Moraniibacteriota bacterium]
MKKIKLLTSFSVFTIFGLTLAKISRANWLTGLSEAGDFGLPDNTPSGVLENVIGWLLFITSFLAVLVIIVSGLMIVLSGGDKDMADKGKKGVQYSVTGLAIIILAYVIIQTVNSLLNP